MDRDRLLPDIENALKELSYVDNAGFSYIDDTILIENVDGSIFRLKLEKIKDRNNDW